MNDTYTHTAVHIGASGFPVGSAWVNKCRAVYLALQSVGVRVIIINHKAAFFEKDYPWIQKEAEYDDLLNKYVSPSPFKSSSFIVRRIDRIIGRFNEFRWLIGNRNTYHYLIYYSQGFFTELILYRVIARLLRKPLIMHYVEYRSSFNYGSRWLMKWNNRLSDRYAPKWTDGSLPISEFLIDHLCQTNPQARYLKVPPLVDFRVFDSVERTDPENGYVLYVGSMAYREVIDTIIEAYKQARTTLDLVLVLNGSKEQVTSFIDEMNRATKAGKHIKVLSDLTYQNLVKVNCRAKGLIIPLRDNIQDIARFPQKIAEYTASGNPIITTDVGEMKYYFTDRENALIAEEYSSDAIARKIEFISDHPEEACKIGKAGYEVGDKNFNSQNIGQKLGEFFRSFNR